MAAAIKLALECLPEPQTYQQGVARRALETTLAAWEADRRA